jgi:ribosomal-protein-alanine N-acetyltransferase
MRLMADFVLRFEGIDTRGASWRVALEWSIRSVNPSDLSDLHDLILQSVEMPWSRPAISEALENLGARCRLAEGLGGSPLGFVLARRISDLLEIDLVGVRPAARRRGVARSLLESLIDEEIAAGAVEARLELAESNDSARALYTGLDFMVVGRRTRYYPDGDAALLLSRTISQGRSLPDS